jgi:hypothetical protein
MDLYRKEGMWREETNEQRLDIGVGLTRKGKIKEPQMLARKAFGKRPRGRPKK